MAFVLGQLYILLSLAFCVLSLEDLVYVKLTKRLQLSWDSELNPGSYGAHSFNQGNVDLFGATTRWQSECNALYATCWSVIRKIFVWKSYFTIL